MSGQEFEDITRWIAELQGDIGELESWRDEISDVREFTWEVFEMYAERGIFSDLNRDLVQGVEQLRDTDPKAYMKGWLYLLNRVAGEGFPQNVEEGADRTPPDEMYVVRMMLADEDELHGINHMLVSPGDPFFPEAQRLHGSQNLDGYEVSPEAGHVMDFDWLWAEQYGYRGIMFYQGVPDEHDDGWEFEFMDQAQAMIYSGVSSGTCLIFRLGGPELPEGASELALEAAGELVEESKPKRGRGRRRR